MKKLLRHLSPYEQSLIVEVFQYSKNLSHALSLTNVFLSRKGKRRCTKHTLTKFLRHVLGDTAYREIINQKKLERQSKRRRYEIHDLAQYIVIE